tara:strand:- start:6871 stop:9366 length:2496 start_codon:yes stop_codon:yes gene_type:complete
MIELPKTNYSGLTVVLDKPSRFDFGGLLSGYAGQFFDNCLLADAKHGVHRGNIEVRTLDECIKPFRDGTKVLLLLGEACMKKFNPATTLGEQRGSPFTYENKICIATYAPQDAFDRKQFFDPSDSEGDGDSDGDDSEGKTTHGKTRRKNWKFWMRQDIRKSVRICKNGLTEYSPDYILYPEAELVCKLLEETKGKDFYFDIETDSCLQLTCFGFSFGDSKVVVVPMMQTYHKPRKYYYDEVTTAKILRALAVCLRDNTVVIHNSMFDLFVLAWRYGIPIGDKVFDTMLSHSRCYIEVEKSLGHCISLYTDLPYHKNEGVFEPHNSAQTEMLYRYNGKDVFAMTLLKAAIEDKAKTIGATESVEQVNRMVVPYLTATLQGMNVNWDKLRGVITSNDRMKIQINRMLSILTGRAEFNSNSPKQVSTYLYDELGLKKPEKDLTNEKTLLQHQLKNEIPAITAILEYRKLTKQSGKLGFTPYRGVYNHDRYNPDGTLTGSYVGSERLTCSYNLAGTTTYRLSSRKLLGQWGDNCQNFEKGLRKIVIPDDGKVFVQCDQAGAEALIVSYLCRAGKFRDLFLNGIKPHVYVALHVFAEQWSKMQDKVDNNTLIRALVAEPKDLKNVEGWKKLETVIKDSDNWEASRRYYFIAKMICHASNYGMKARTFRINVLQKSDGAIAKSVAECEQMLATYHNLFPEIGAWHNDVVAAVKRWSMLKNLFGHPRIFTGHQDESAWKEWFAFVPQSTVGQITNYAFTELQEEVFAGKHPLDIDILENNHDSILAQCLPENKEYVAKLISSKLNRKLMSPRAEEFYMKSEAQYSEKSWGEMTELTNK